MARWTQNQDDERRLIQVNKELWVAAERGGWRIKILLYDGRSIEGRWMRISSGNNAGRGNHWTYYGSVTVENSDGMHEIDLLDIDHIVEGKIPA